MTVKYCKYCGKYKSKRQFSEMGFRCNHCERMAEIRFNAILELEKICKAAQHNPLRPNKKVPLASPELIAKRKREQERRDLRAIEEEYL